MQGLCKPVCFERRSKHRLESRSEGLNYIFVVAKNVKTKET